MALVLGIIGLALTGTSIGIGASGATQPNQPNLAASSRAMANAMAQLLPIERQMQAEAELGGSTLLPGYTQSTDTAQLTNKLNGELSGLQNQLAAAEKQSANNLGKGAGVAGIQNKIADVQAQLAAIPKGAGATVYLNKQGKVVPQSQAMANFAGLSQADIQGKIMTELAQGQLDLSKKDDAAFIASALAQEQQADPQSFAARAELSKLIQQQIANPPQSPVSQEMQNQVQARVSAGQGLTPEENALLQQAVGSGASDRGGGPATDFSQDLTTGFAGEQRGLANAAAGTNWLASGETPDDIAYRAEQQNLANLGNFIGGRTPQAQFRELSGAQAGPTPNAGQGPALMTLPGNAGQVGAQGAITGYGYQAQNALNQANPWMAGLSGVLGALNVAGSAGWSPLAGQNQLSGVGG